MFTDKNGEIYLGYANKDLDGFSRKERKKFERLENREIKVDEEEELDRRLLEKQRWFAMMEGEDGSNICRSCPTIAEDRSDFVIDNNLLKSMDTSADVRRFLDDYFDNSNDKRYRRLFLAYFDLSDDDVMDVVNDMGINMRQADTIVNHEILPKMRNAAMTSPILC
jgi:hypothetical protein